MRIVAAILLSATCFSVGISCHAEDFCSFRQAPAKPGGKPLTASDVVHHVLLTTVPEN
jgi:hypothetical protein